MAFARRVEAFEYVPLNEELLKQSSTGMMTEISREYRLMEKEVDPELIRLSKQRIKKLRVIRGDMKKCLKQIYAQLKAA